MWTCPVCESEYDGQLCGCCGYEPSSDYERHLTLAPIAEGTESIEGLRAAYLASLRREECPCCGRKATGDFCGFCGFHVAGLKGIRSQAMVDTLAAEHRERLLGDLQDIAVVNYHYHWNPETSRLEMHHADEHILAQGQDCHPGVWWSAPMFGQLSTQDYPTLELMLSYRWRGKRKTCRISVPTVRTDDFWQVGLLIDDQLCLRVFLGCPTEFTTSQPIPLETD